MTTSKLGPLTVRRIVKPDVTGENHVDMVARSPLVIVLCHGFGAPGDDLVGLTESLDVPAGSVLVFPEAPHALRDLFSAPVYGDARAWWPIDMARLERSLARGEVRDLTSEVPEGLASARQALSSMLDELAKQVPADHRLVLGGFSQGAMLALDVALREPSRKLAGLILLSGTMIAEHEWTPRMSGRRGTPVFQSHGKSDPILSFAIAERMSDVLKSEGLDVTFESFQGPHTVPESTLEKLGRWLRAALSDRPKTEAHA